MDRKWIAEYYVDSMQGSPVSILRGGQWAASLFWQWVSCCNPFVIYDHILHIKAAGYL